MTSVSSSTDEQQFTSPFEVVYTVFYAVSLFGIAGDLVHRTFQGGLSEWMFVSAVFGLFVCFQFLRMYSYLHEFDRKLWSSRRHFTQCVTGFQRFFDRLLRLGLASLLIFATKIQLDAGMMRLQLGSWESGILARFGFQTQTDMLLANASEARLDLVTVYSFWLSLVFLLLFFWDVNVCVALARLGKKDPTRFESFGPTADKFFHLSKEQLELLKSDGAVYFASGKFWERCFGILFSLGALAYSARPTPIPLIIAAVCLAMFVFSFKNNFREELRALLTLFIVIGDYFEIGRRNPSAVAIPVRAPETGT